MKDKKYTSEEALKKAFDNHTMPFDEKAFAQFGQALDKVPAVTSSSWVSVIKSKIFFAAAAVTTTAFVFNLSISDELESSNNPLDDSTSDVLIEQVIDKKNEGSTDLNKSLISENNLKDKLIDKKTQVELITSDNENESSENEDALKAEKNNVLKRGIENPSVLPETGVLKKSLRDDVLSKAETKNVVEEKAEIVDLERMAQDRQDSEKNKYTSAKQATLSQSSTLSQTDQLPTQPQVNEHETLSRSFEKSRLKDQVLTLENVAPLDLSNINSQSDQFNESLLLDFYPAEIKPSAFKDAYKNRGYFYVMPSVLLTSDVHDFSDDPYFTQGDTKQVNWRLNVGYQINRSWAVELGFMKRVVNQAWEVSKEFNEGWTGAGYKLFPSTYLSTRVIGTLNLYENKFFVTPKLGYTLGNPDIMLGEIGNGTGTIQNYPANDRTLDYEHFTEGLRENAFHVLELGLGVEYALTNHINLNLSYGRFTSFNDVQLQNIEYRVDEGDLQNVEIKSNGTFSAFELGFKYNFQ